MSFPAANVNFAGGSVYKIEADGDAFFKGIQANAADAATGYGGVNPFITVFDNGTSSAYGMTLGHDNTAFGLRVFTGVGSIMFSVTNANALHSLLDCQDSFKNPCHYGKTWRNQCAG